MTWWRFKAQNTSRIDKSKRQGEEPYTHTHTHGQECPSAFACPPACRNHSTQYLTSCRVKETAVSGLSTGNSLSLYIYLCRDIHAYAHIYIYIYIHIYIYVHINFIYIYMYIYIYIYISIYVYIERERERDRHTMKYAGIPCMYGICSVHFLHCIYTYIHFRDFRAQWWVTTWRLTI